MWVCYHYVWDVSSICGTEIAALLHAQVLKYWNVLAVCYRGTQYASLFLSRYLRTYFLYAFQNFAAAIWIGGMISLTLQQSSPNVDIGSVNDLPASAFVLNNLERYDYKSCPYRSMLNCQLGPSRPSASLSIGAFRYSPVSLAFPFTR